MSKVKILPSPNFYGDDCTSLMIGFGKVRFGVVLSGMVRLGKVRWG